MNIRHIFNRHQEQFMYLFAGLFLGVIIVFYLWGISIIMTSIEASFQTETSASPLMSFDFSLLKNIPLLNVSSSTP